MGFNSVRWGLKLVGAPWIYSSNPELNISASYTTSFIAPCVILFMCRAITHATAGPTYLISSAAPVLSPPTPHHTPPRPTDPLRAAANPSVLQMLGNYSPASRVGFVTSQTLCCVFPFWFSSNLVIFLKFGVCGSVHVGKIYMFNSGRTRCTMYSLFISSLVLHVSGAICTHHQEQNCSVQP
jgi:hypothetical protein